MEEIYRLIETIKESKQQQAIYRLIEMGMPAIPAIIDEIRKSPTRAIQAFRNIILQIQSPEIVPRLLELLDEKNIKLRMTAFEALGRSKNEQAIQPLLDILLNPKKRVDIRADAANALGELGYPVAIEGLLKVTEEYLGNSNDPKVIENIANKSNEHVLNMMIDVIIALAKLGNHQMAPAVISLTYFELEKKISRIRTNASWAMRYIVGPGMFPALKRVLRDHDFDVREGALESMFYLGTKETIEELLLLIEEEIKKSDSSEIKSFAFAKIYNLVGGWPWDELFEDDIGVENLHEWWNQAESVFKSGICYRLGKPLLLVDLIDLLKYPNKRRPITEELCIITGHDFGFNSYFPAEDQDEVLIRAKLWWEKEGNQFESGALYKYGHKLNIRDIF